MTITITTTADAALIDLGGQLAAAIDAERHAIAGLTFLGKQDDDAAMKIICEPASQIIEQMRRLRPTTLMGFAAVQLAIAWVDGSLPTDLENFTE